MQRYSVQNCNEILDIIRLQLTKYDKKYKKKYGEAIQCDKE